MDPRIREHAEIVATHSVDMQSGDAVVIDAHPAAANLVVALMEVVGERGADPVVTTQRAGNRYRRAFLRSSDGTFETPAHERALIEHTDVYIAVRGGANVTETSDVDPERLSAYSRARRPILDERLSKRWNLTQFPTASGAQLARMSTEGYQNFVWDAICRDWEAQRDHQAEMAERLSAGDAVRIVSGEETDLTMRVGGNPAINDYGEHNMPGGEVFTAPHPASVEGTVLFDLPLYHRGREITDVRLSFEDGEVVGHAAESNEDLLTEVLETDAGARRLGELGIGMNRSIDRFTYNMLFDEKMGDTVHMAVGRAYEDTVGGGNERNESAVHVDMIVDMSEDSRIEIDGEVVQRDGRFWFEDGF